MSNLSLSITNRKSSTLMTSLIIVFAMATIFMPFLLTHFIPQSGIGNYIGQYFYYIYYCIPVLIYFIYTGVFYYHIKIDAYTVNIRSNRTISGVFRPLNRIDVAHSMVTDFTFFNRGISFNQVLMIKIETATGKKIAKRFMLTLLSKKDKDKISQSLKQIIAKNS